MASWRARGISAAIRLCVRRQTWGDDEHALARRARRLLNTLRPLGWLPSLDVTVRPVRDGGVRGEWVVSEPSRNGAILYLHGGGYVSGSPATHRPLTAALARRTGRRVFALDYRLAPEHRFPAAVDDAVAAYRWMLSAGIAPASIAVAGDSAGGGLALAMLLRIRDEGVALPSCAVCFSPWTDLQGTGDSLRLNMGRCAMFHPHNIQQFALAYLHGESPLNAYASPAFGHLGGLPPLLLQTGSGELLLDDARRVDAAVREASGTSCLQIFQDMFHVWQLFGGIVPEADRALHQAASFMNEQQHRGHCG